MPRKGEVTLTVLATGTGLDVALATPAKISPRSVPQIVEQAMGAGFARLSLNGETLVEARAPILSVDGLPLVPPPGGFVQATLAGEQALAKLIRDGQVGPCPLPVGKLRLVQKRPDLLFALLLNLGLANQPLLED